MFSTLTKPKGGTELQLTSPGQYRITAIDLLRGLVMIIMALDHTRDFIHKEALLEDPLNFATTTPFLFFTRWITHYCAPIFVFLAGTSGFFQSLRKSKADLCGFLIKRGLWLILVEVTIITFAISFDVQFNTFFLQVIWAIGISMVLLGFAVWLPFYVILAIGLLIVLGHNSLDFYEANKKEGFGIYYALLRRPDFVPIGGNRTLGILYPFLPWTGVMFLGYCFGKLFIHYEGGQRRRILTRLGLSIIILFIALRATNSYGDPLPWATQKSSVFTILSFVNTTKYPPSLLHLCMTLGPAILFLAFTDTFKNALSKLITVYGKVPFFYYVLHMYLIHGVSAFFFFLRGHGFGENASGTLGFPFRFVVPGEGLSLFLTYLVWLAIVAALYPACRWFSRYKQTHKQWWLSYL